MVYCAFTPLPSQMSWRVSVSGLNNAVFTDNVSLASLQVMSTFIQVASVSPTPLLTPLIS